MVDLDFLPWCLTLQIIACTFHCVAIASTVFRLIYRWYIARFWWEDGWVTVALLVDIPCLVSVWIEPPDKGHGPAPPIDKIARWIAQLSFTTVSWACRMSILFSIIRITHPSRQLRRLAFFVGCSFVAMWAGSMIQKIQICLKTCVAGTSIGISQLITNTIADAILVALPIWYFRQTQITALQRIMLYPVFFATLLITVIAIFRSSILFTTSSSGIIVVGHIKTTVSLIVCNLLVILTLFYRLCHRGKANDLDATLELITFTNVDLNTGFTATTSTNKETSITADGSEEAPSSVGSFSITEEEYRRFSSCSV